MRAIWSEFIFLAWLVPHDQEKKPFWKLQGTVMFWQTNKNTKEAVLVPIGQNLHPVLYGQLGLRTGMQNIFYISILAMFK